MKVRRGKCGGSKLETARARQSHHTGWRVIQHNIRQLSCAHRQRVSFIQQPAHKPTMSGPGLVQKHRTCHDVWCAVNGAQPVCYTSCQQVKLHHASECTCATALIA